MKTAQRMLTVLFAGFAAATSTLQAAVTATGGVVTNYMEGEVAYQAHLFKDVGSASLNVFAEGVVQVLVVAGGGGGGANGGGGGGAGGVLYTNAWPVGAGSYTVVVGGGGAGSADGNAAGTSGANSSFGTLVAIGGGGGASRDNGPAGLAGGSGGGGGGSDQAARRVAGAGTAGQGNSGGSGAGTGAPSAGGGGGGAGGVGSAATQKHGGNGGVGLAYGFSGVSAYYGGGGGGGLTCTYADDVPGTGGLGGGGNGCRGVVNHGAANTGGGGGGGTGTPAAGGTSYKANGGNGGSGIVIVRYELDVTIPRVETGIATNVTASSAWLCGNLVSTGASATAAIAYWGTADAGTNAASWAHSATLAAPQPEGAFSVQATGLSADSTCYYRMAASNDAGVAWADASAFFITGELTLTKTSDALEETQTPGVFTVARPGTTTAEALEVFYAQTAGTATGGVDFVALSGSVAIPAGQTTATIAVVPVYNPVDADATLTLTLLPGAYAIGSPASAEMTITNRPAPAYAHGVFVDSTAAGANDGSSWIHAFTSVQPAFDYAVANGITNIHLAGRTFAAAADGTKVYSLASAANLLIRGGYKADPADPVLPGPRDPAQWPTALARSGATAGRVLNLSGLGNVRFEGVTIRGGNYGGGGGIGVSGSTGGVTFDNCTITNNYSNNGQGGGFYITTSTVTLTNCLVQGNTGARGNDGTPAYGGAAYLFSSGILNVYRSTIAQNTALSSRDVTSRGGAFYLGASTSELNVWESVVTNNAATTEWDGGIGRGGAIYNNGGKVRLRNVLIARNTTRLTGTDPSSGILSDGATAYVLLENCTVADNDAGKSGSVGLRRNSTGVFAVTNSIVVNHVADLVNFNFAHVGYSNIGDGQNAGFNGCHAVVPQFADTLFYHLKSTAGHYAGGAFGGGAWTTASASSPLIDRGNPASAFGREPAPNGARVNLGAYGNTEVASKTPTVSATSPAVSNDGSILRGHTSARLRGTLDDDGGQLPDVAFHYWETGTTTTNIVPIGMREEGAFAWTIGGLTAGLNYEYRIGAANGAGTAWSGVASFGALPANATVYVASTGDNSDGLTWGTAFTDAVTAFAFADSGDTIRFAGETFAAAPGFALAYVYRLASKSNVRIEGGYQATGTTPGPRDPALWPTVLARMTSAAGARVMNLESLADVTFDGLTFQDGNGITGGGIYVSDASGVVLANCRIVSNKSGSNALSPTGGGGLWLNSGTVVLTNSWVGNNQITQGATDNYHARGGGIYVAGGTLTVRNSIIANNLAYGSDRLIDTTYYGADGGGAYIASGGILDMAESVVTNNSCLKGYWPNGYVRGGGVANVGGIARLRNVLIARNLTALPSSIDNSSGLFSGSAGTAKTSLDNCTVADNDFGKATAVGVRYGAGTLAVTNCIVWGHAGGDLSNFPVDGGAVRNVGWSLFNDATMHGVAGCVSADPLFAAPAAGDYRLGAGSPAINVGKTLPWMIGATDLVGVKRVQGGAVDLGVYEVPAAAATLILVR